MNFVSQFHKEERQVKKEPNGWPAEAMLLQARNLFSPSRMSHRLQQHHERDERCDRCESEQDTRRACGLCVVDQVIRIPAIHSTRAADVIDHDLP